MLERRGRGQQTLFLYCQLSDLVPEDHILKLIDRAVDLSWVRSEVTDCYCMDNGRPGVDPESLLRLMLAGLLEGITSDRKLMRQAQVNVAMRWFAGYRLDEALPDHSTLTYVRHRWGQERFRRIFERTVRLCVEAGLVGGGVTHVDATLIRADVSWESLVEEHVARVLAENELEQDEPSGPVAPEGKAPEGTRTGKRAKKGKKGKKRSLTDPDASMTTAKHNYHMEPAYKQHTAVDDRSGVIVDVAVQTGEASEGKQLAEQLDRVEAATGLQMQTVTADAAYAHTANYAHLEERGVEAVIPPQRQRHSKKRIALGRFQYDAQADVVRCPRKKRLTRRTRGGNGGWYRADAGDCARCPLRSRCLGSKTASRGVFIVDGYPSLLRARRRWRGRSEQMREAYRRHRWRVEGVHGEAKTQHGLRRAARRGLWSVAIQVYLTAAAMNLKRLGRALGGPFDALSQRLGAPLRHLSGLLESCRAAP